MKKVSFLLMLLFGGMSAFAQPLQLSKWFAAPNELDLRATSPTVTGLTGAPGPGTNNSYNAWYENGTLLFYVMNTSSGAIIYRGSNHTSMGSLFSTAPVQGKIGIVPHTDNFTTLCAKKFWIISNVFTIGNSSGTMVAGLLDMNTGSYSPIVFNFGVTTRTNVPFAVSKMDANGDRYVYVADRNPSANGLDIYKLNSSGFSLASSTGYNVIGTEMELTNNGDKLAFVLNNTTIRAINLGTNHLPSSGFTNINATGVAGMEFDNTGNKLFFSTTGGISVYNFTSSAYSSVGSSIGYATGMLEKSYENGTPGSMIICGNATTLGRINPSTNSLDSWTASYQGLVMPHQIDGEDADDKAFNIGLPSVFHVYCQSSHTFSITYWVHPYIVMLGTYAMKVQYIGNWTGPFLPANWGPPSAMALSNTHNTYNFPISATSSFMVTLYNTTNSSACTATRGMSFYLHGCPTIGYYNNWYDYTTQIYGRVVSNPQFPGEEPGTAGFDNAWTVQELDPETNLPLYSVSGGCWHTEPGQSQAYAGFNPIDNDYAAMYAANGGVPIDVDCSAGERGMFQYGHTYRTIRTVWDGTTGPDNAQVFDDIFILYPDGTVGPPTDDGGDGAKLGNTGTATITQNALEQTLVYPNPASGIVKVKTNFTEPGRLEIYDVRGTRVREAAVGSKEQTNTLDVSDLSKGVYMLKVYSGGSMHQQKIVLQ